MAYRLLYCLSSIQKAGGAEAPPSHRLTIVGESLDRYAAKSTASIFYF